jgi:GGDEF domain-containing protein
VATASADAWLVEADRAMYAAKAAGRDGVTVRRPRADSLT